MHYLDHAATTPVPRTVAGEMVRVLTEDFGNPSSQYALGRAARDLVDRSRQTIANALGCEAKQLYFTSCGTEADNWALRAALHQNRRTGRYRRGAQRGAPVRQGPGAGGIRDHIP